MLIQILIVLFIVYVFGRMLKKFRKGELSRREFIWWSILWSVIITATLLPKTTDIVANFLGVGRGYDLSVYISIIILFYLMFRMMIKIDQIDRNITKIVRKISISDKLNEDK